MWQGPLPVSFDALEEVQVEDSLQRWPERYSDGRVRCRRLCGASTRQVDVVFAPSLSRNRGHAPRRSSFLEAAIPIGFHEGGVQVKVASVFAFCAAGVPEFGQHFRQRHEVQFSFTKKLSRRWHFGRGNVSATKRCVGVHLSVSHLAPIRLYECLISCASSST